MKLGLFYLDRAWEICGGGGADEIIAEPEPGADLDLKEPTVG